MKSIILIASLALIIGCTSTKNTQPTETTMDESSEAKEMIAKGFLMGTIKAYETEGNCPFVIEVAGETPYYLDPIDLDESFKQNDMKVWFTFFGLRMMNRCEKANPVKINEIKKRAE